MRIAYIVPSNMFLFCLWRLGWRLWWGGPGGWKCQFIKSLICWSWCACCCCRMSMLMFMISKLLDVFITWITVEGRQCLIANVPGIHYFLQGEFSYVSSDCFSEQRQSRIGCICVIFPQCEFSFVSSGCLSEQTPSCNGRICEPFPQCEYSYVPSSFLHRQMQNRIGCTCLSFPLCELSNATSGH